MICSVLLPVGIHNAPFLVFTALSPPRGECLIQAGGPAGMDTARRWGILCSGAVAREEGLQPREISCQSLERRRILVISEFTILGDLGSVEQLSLRELQNLRKEWCSEIRSTLTRLRSRPHLSSHPLRSPAVSCFNISSPALFTPPKSTARN